MRREGIIGGLEEMVAFIEDVAQRQAAFLSVIERCLDHHKRMIGDDELCRASTPNRLFNEAVFPEVTGGVNAFTASVHQGREPPAPYQFTKPAREISAGEVAVTGPQGPARDQTKCYGPFPRSEEHTSELQSRENLVCRLLLARTTRPSVPELLHDALPILKQFFQKSQAE